MVNCHMYKLTLIRAKPHTFYLNDGSDIFDCCTLENIIGCNQNEFSQRKVPTKLTEKDNSQNI